MTQSAILDSPTHQQRPRAAESPILTIEDAAAIVPLSLKTLYRVARSGEGPFVKVEGRWLVYEDDLHRWIRSHGAPKRASSGGDHLADRVRRRRENHGQ